ncbi:cTAGE family member 5 isoform X2 [Antennarius striatus]|uniref:cTAGE family member 5 isoform X2 n=1 Tax=Antennarius striatus TaxID=241820 RepID=UPI0035AEFFF5
MTISPVYKHLWVTSTVFVILPHLYLGLLSDYKICGDSECESPMSRVVAIRDHRGKDCRFLSFTPGDTIFVYHKLTGRREDLWAGSIGKRFGYFQKDAVREKHVFAIMEKVVVTQESDFFCMDEFGYLIDSSHLDSDDDNMILNQESETTQTAQHPADTNVKSPPSEDISSEVDLTLTAEDKPKNTDVTTDSAQVEAQDAPVALNEQGGSASSGWLGSSVTGWLGLDTVEEPGNMAEGGESGDRTEKPARASLVSSVSEWFGLEGEEQSDDAEERREEGKEVVDSFASSVTGWFGFGGEERRDDSSDEDQNKETDHGEEQEPAETFRSRRMSLDLEGSRLQEEVNEEIGTLDWLGKELMGFGLTNHASGQETTTERNQADTIQAEEEQPESSYWFDLGISDILGFRKDNSEVDGSTSGFTEPKEEEILQETTQSENMNTSKSQNTLTEDGRTEISNELEVEETLKETTDQSEQEIVTGSEDNNKRDIGTPDSSTDTASPDHTASEGSQENSSPPNKLEEKTQDAGGLTSVISSLFQIGGELEEERDTLDDEEKDTNTLVGKTSAEMTDEAQSPKSAELRGNDDEDRETGEQMKESDIASVNLNSNSKGQSLSEEDQTGEISNSIDKTEESAEISGKIGTGSDDHESEGSYPERSASHKETASSQMDAATIQSDVDGTGVKESRGENKASLASSAAGDRNEPASNEDQPAPSKETSVHHSGPLVMAKNKPEAETHQGEFRQESPVGSHSTNRSTDTIPEGTFYTHDKTTLLADVSVDSPHIQQTERRQDNSVQAETVKFEDDALNESDTHLEREEVEESKNEEMEAETVELKHDEEVKVLGKLQEVNEEMQEETEEVKEEEKQQVLTDIKEDDKHEEIGRGQKEEMQELVVKDETQTEMEGLKEEENQAEKGEFEDEVEEIKRTNNLQKDGDKQATKDLKEYKKQVEEEKLDKDEIQQQNNGLKEEMQKEVEDERTEEKQAGTEELMEDEKIGTLGTQQEVDEEKQEEAEDLQEEVKQEVLKEIEEDKQEMIKEVKMDEIEVAEKQTEDLEEKQEELEEERIEGVIEVEEMKVEEEVDGDKLIQSSHFEVEVENLHNLSFGNQKDNTRPESESTEGEKNITEEDERGVEEDKERNLNVPSEGIARDEVREMLEERSFDNTEADGTKDELTEKKSELIITGNKVIKSKNAFDLKAVEEDVISEQSTSYVSEDPTGSSFLSGGGVKSEAESGGGRGGEGGGGLGIFQNTFNFFTQPSASESIEPTQSLDSLTSDISSLTSEQDPDSSTITNTNHQAEASCFSGSCSTHNKDEEMAAEEESDNVGESSDFLDSNTPRDDWMRLDKEKSELNEGGEKEKVIEDGKRLGKIKRSKEEQLFTESRLHVQPGTQPQEGVMEQIVDLAHQIAEDSTTHIHAAKQLLIWLIIQVVSTLPDDIRPGPDLYGVPWEPVIISSMVGLMTVLLFSCRCYSSVKSRLYQSKERRMAEQVAQLLNEKCKVLETLSKCQQEYDDLENSLRNNGVLAQTEETELLQGKVTQLGHANAELGKDLEQLKDQLLQQRGHRREQEKRIAVLEEDMKKIEEETRDLQSQDEQAQTTLKVYNMNNDRLQRNLETAGEANTLLLESNAHLKQQVEGWAERVSELDAEISRCEVSHSAMLQDVANKDERIMSLTDRLLRMKAWDSDLESEGDQEGRENETTDGTARRGEENGSGDKTDTQTHLQKVQKLIYAAKLNADLKSVDEDKDRAFAKLNDEVKAKEDLLVSIKEMENEKISLHSDKEHFSDQVQRLQQKLNIMTEMYQENELKLHRLLTVEEKERLQKEEKLNKADKNIAMAMEELNNYRQRATEMEEELEKTKQSYQTQMSAHEKKAHNNWLAARAAERELADIRRENGLLRQKLTDTQFKLDALDKDPYALDSLARPLPFRAERSPYGPSPLGRPTSETRPFLSPPTLMDAPPTRLSPRAPSGGQVEMERSGGPHSDSGSSSPTWERDRRGPPPGPPGPLGPPGYMFPEQGGPMYRRPPPPPGALGFLPPPGALLPPPLHLRSLPPGPPHPADMADGAYRENSLGPGEQELRGPSPGDRRSPPESDPRMGGAPPPGPPMGPMDGPFPRRAPFGLPPPDFYPPRGPRVLPVMPMWAPPPPGVMFPPRFPPGGPPLPHYAPPMRAPLHDGLPPPSMGPLPSAPHSQSPDEHIPKPEDAI